MYKTKKKTKWNINFPCCYVIPWGVDIPGPFASHDLSCTMSFPATPTRMMMAYKRSICSILITSTMCVPSSSSVQYYYSNGSRCNKFEGSPLLCHQTPRIILLLVPPLQDSQMKLANILHPCRTSSTTADGSSGGWRQTGARNKERTNWKIMPQWIRCRYKRIYCWHFHPWMARDVVCEVVFGTPENRTTRDVPISRNVR